MSAASVQRERPAAARAAIASRVDFMPRTLRSDDDGSVTARKCGGGATLTLFHNFVVIGVQPVRHRRVVQRHQRRTTMEKRQVTVRNRSGIHARAAAKLVTLCARYRSRVVIFCNGRKADGKHMIALLTLSAAMGAQVVIEVNG